MMVIGYPMGKMLRLKTHFTDSPSLTKDMMIMEDIQTHYESLVDEVISSQSEDFLLSMSWFMSKEKINTVYRPQVSMLMANHPNIHDKCLLQVPQWIGKYLQGIHSRAYEIIAPKVHDHMLSHWQSSRLYAADITTSDIVEFLTSLNYELSIITTLQMDPRLALIQIGRQLQSCQQKRQKYRRWDIRSILSGKLFDYTAHQQLPSAYDVNGSMKHHFLVKFLTNMQSAIFTQMQDGIPDLIPLIRDDLFDQFVDA